MVSKLFIVCGYLLEYMFASSFGALIRSSNGGIFIAEDTAYSPNNFNVFLIMMCGIVNGIFNGVFHGLTKYPVAPAIDAFTKDCSSTVRSVVETITTIFCVYFRDTFANHFQLSMLKKFKIDNNSNNDNNTNNMQDQDETKQMETMDYHEFNHNDGHDSILGDGDNVTVIREATGITGVSSIAAPPLLDVY